MLQSEGLTYRQWSFILGFCWCSITYGCILFWLSPFCIRNYEFILIIRAESTDRPPIFLPMCCSWTAHFSLLLICSQRCTAPLLRCAWMTNCKQNKVCHGKKDRKQLNMSFLHTYNAFSIQVAAAHTENQLVWSSHMSKKPLGKEYGNKDTEDQLRSLNPNNPSKRPRAPTPEGSVAPVQEQHPQASSSPATESQGTGRWLPLLYRTCL